MSVSEVFQCDNSGNRVPPTPHLANPVAGSGVQLDAGKDVAGTKTVVGGQMYIVSTCGSRAGRWLFSITGACTTVGNIEWVCAQGEKIIIKIPVGTVILHYLQKDQNGFGYLNTLDPEN